MAPSALAGGVATETALLMMQRINSTDASVTFKTPPSTCVA
jgi:hypothetical protein